MTDNIIYNLPEEVRPEYIQLYATPVRDDGSVYLDSIRFRAHQGEEVQLDFYLAIYGDRYNGLPGLHYDFGIPKPSEVWVRLTWRNDVHDRGNRFMLTLAYEEAFSDPSYGYGDNTYSFAPGIALGFQNGTPPNYIAESNNVGTTTGTTATSYGSTIDVAPIVDFHVKRIGTHSLSGPGGIWSTEVYENGTLRWSGTIYNDANPGHPLGQAGIGALVINTQYASYTGTNVISLDNIMAGTSQGAQDLMVEEGFDDGTFGVLIDDSNDPTDPAEASFVVQNAAIGE